MAVFSVVLEPPVTVTHPEGGLESLGNSHRSFLATWHFDFFPKGRQRDRACLFFLQMPVTTGAGPGGRPDSVQLSPWVAGTQLPPGKLGSGTKPRHSDADEDFLATRPTPAPLPTFMRLSPDGGHCSRSPRFSCPNRRNLARSHRTSSVC